MGTNFWLATDDGKFFFRQYRPYGTERIREIHAVKKFFAERGIPVVLPIKTKAGETFFEKDSVSYALFPFLPHAVVERNALSDLQITHLGAFLAKLHLIGNVQEPFTKEKEKPWSLERLAGKMAPILEKIGARAEHSAFDERVLEKLRLQQELASAQTEPYQVVYPPHLTHNDFHEGNVFFAPDETIAFIFDWEKAQMGSRGRELVRALELLFFREEHSVEAFRKANVFMRAYQAVYPISREEFRDGVWRRYMNLLHSVWIEEEHYLNGNTRVDELMERDFRNLQYYALHLEEYVEAFFLP